MKNLAAIWLAGFLPFSICNAKKPPYRSCTEAQKYEDEEKRVNYLNNDIKERFLSSNE